MYPGPSKSPENHKRGFCSDGCPVTLKRFKNESGTYEDSSPPPFPQPVGIFVEGEVFHLHRFMEVVNDVYKRIVLKAGTGSNETTMLEDEMFVRMLQSRVVQLSDGQNIFRLYPGLRIEPPTQTDLLMERDGGRFLRLPMIADTEFVAQPC